MRKTIISLFLLLGLMVAMPAEAAKKKQEKQQSDRE